MQSNIQSAEMNNSTNSFKQQIADSATEYIEENKKIREERKEQLYLNEVLRYKMKDRVYSTYEGIDIAEGKILNLNAVDEIETDEDNTLYSAYIQKRDNEDEIEQKSIPTIPNGFPTLFTTQTKLEDIANNGNEKEVQGFLKLISDLPKDMLNLNEMKFIGSLDKEGRITRTTENCSERINQLIEEQKEKYKTIIEKKNEKTR